MVEQLVFHWYFRLRTKACFTDRTDHTPFGMRVAHTGYHHGGLPNDRLPRSQAPFSHVIFSSLH